MSIFIFIVIIGAIIYYATESNGSVDTPNPPKKKDTNKTSEKESYEQILSNTKERLILKSDRRQPPIQKDKNLSIPPGWKATPAVTKLTPLQQEIKKRIQSRQPVWKATPAVTKLTPLQQAFKSHNVHSLWHMTHIDNLESVLRFGILSHELAHSTANPTDISNQDVNKRRNREDPINRRNIHSYAPTYINIKNPMLYVKKDSNKELCILEISLDVLDGSESVIFSDGNAASGSTRFFSRPEDLGKLPWTVLQSDRWNNHEDGKRKMCSEVLIYPKIDIKYVTKIHCCSSDTLNKIRDIIRSSNLKYHAQLNEDLYFR